MLPPSSLPSRDLTTHPASSPADLGLPLPPTTHAVSVALPTWQDVIDYEEGHPRIAAALQAGYPRFFLHPLVSALFDHATQLLASKNEGCLVFPDIFSAQVAENYFSRKHSLPARIRPLGHGSLHALLFPEPHRQTARDAWRYTGAIVSSRLADRALTDPNSLVDPTLLAAGAAAKHTLRTRLAHLYHVAPTDIFFFPSGMAAMVAAHRLVTLLHPNLPTVQLDFPYVDVLRVQQEFGSGVHFFPIADAPALEKIAALASEQSIAAVFAEIPSNPLLSCAPIHSLADSLRAANIPLVLDDSGATGVNINALAHADLVTTSLTKAFSGTGDVIAGALTLNPASPHYAFFKQSLTTQPDLLWAEDAIVLEENSRDFPARVQRMNQTTATLTDFLSTHPDVTRVWYPPHPAAFGRMAQPHGGRGCLFSFLLADPTAAAACYDSLQLSKGPSLGTNFSLCCPYTLLAHYPELDWAASCGVPAHLLRVSVGLEDPADLIARFTAALANLPTC